MNRAIRLFILLLVFTLAVSFADASGFTQDGDAIEEATKSVLKLYVYDDVEAATEDYIGTASGFVAFNSSTLITNYHVIENARDIWAIDDQGNSYGLVFILAADKDADIAILEFRNPTGLHPLELYADDQLKRGSSIIAIGSPKETRNTVSRGVISNVYYDGYIPRIQIDAAISPGSSGGALFNDNGKVIGVTTSGYKTKDEYGEDTEAQNINFAINIAVAKAMYKAWDGTRSTFANHKTTAKMDFTDVYQHDESTEKKVEETVETASNSSPVAENWTCLNCGAVNSDRFCQNCGAEKPNWICACGKTNSGKFCGSCGRKADELVAETDRALECISKNNFEEAINIFTGLAEFDSGSFATAKGTHTCAKDCISEVYYSQGMYLVSIAGDHEEILDSFKKAGNYGDAKAQIEAENDRFYQSLYTKGTEYAEKGEYLEAISYFEAAGDYSDSKKKIRETYYLYGEALLNAKKFEDSRKAFEKAGDYRDASDMILKAFYEEGLESYDLGNYKEAIDLFSKAGEYPNAKQSAQKSQYALGKEAMEKGRFEEAEQFFTYAEGYEDSDALIEQVKEAKKEKEYLFAQKLYKEGKYTKAKSAFLKLTGYKDAERMEKLASIKVIEQEYRRAEMESVQFRSTFTMLSKKLEPYLDFEEAQELFKEIEYSLGIRSLNVKAYTYAIDHFEKADDYEDAASMLIATKDTYFKKLLQEEDYEGASQFYHSKMEPFGQSAETVLMRPGDTGEIPKYILEIIRIVEFGRNIPKEEDNYNEKYIEGVQKFEEHFGLTADGELTLDEFVKVGNLIYKGCKSDKVQDLVEKLYDLSYLRSLAEDHTVYENNYFNGVKAAEKALGLLVDGVVTPEEYETILKQKVNIDKPENLKVQINKDTVTITWNRVQGAIEYKVYDGDKLLGSTKECRWVEKNVDTGVAKNFRIVANKYTVKSSANISKYIDPYYKPISAEDLNKGKQNAIGKNVSLSNLKIRDWKVDMGGKFESTSNAKAKAQMFDGYDVYLLCSTDDSYVEVILEDYKGWEWDDHTTDVLGMIKKIKSISVRGTVESNNGYWPHWGQRMNLPSVVINHIEWNYK